MTPEGKIAAYLVRRVKELGGQQRKVEWSGRTGAPDRLVMFPRSFAFVELKAPGEKPKPHQVREIELMNRCGLPTYVVDSKEGVDELLENILGNSFMRCYTRGEVQL